MSERLLKGIGVSAGIAVGPAVVVRWTMPEVPHRVVPRSQVEKEVRRLRAAVRDVKRYLQDLRAKAEDRAGVDEARIFDAQLLMLEDKEFLSVVGLVSEEGTRTSHAAILAHSIGIPAVFGVAGAMQRIEQGTTLVMDGTRGTVLLNPTAQEIAEAQARERRRRELASQLEEVVDQPAVTTDGVRILLRGNVDLPDEIRAAQQHRAEGVGLLRTEFLITSHTTLPTEDEQAAYFRRVGEAFKGHPVVIRTYDLGGDKLPGPFRVQAEANPQLGWRAIRVCLDRPEIFRTQVRAALRAAAHADIQVMIPLVTRLDEVDRTRVIVGEEAANLRRDGVEAPSAGPGGVVVGTAAAGGSG